MRRDIFRPRGEGGIFRLHECRRPFVNDGAISLPRVDVNPVFLEICYPYPEQIASL
jgi:hypothetical protein